MVRPGSSAPLWGVAGKAGYALSCVAAALVLAVSGFTYFVVRDVSSIGGSHAINSGPSIGAQNILLMGLESRTDWNGNVLPNDILNALHAGSRQGVLGDLGKINSLLSVAKQYVITDSGWNLLDFATQMRSLTSGNLSFNTLPIESYITIAGQSANQVNVPYIQQLIRNTFYPVPSVSGSAKPKP